MNAYDFVHLALHALDGEVKGKTLLQKKIYFLGIMTGVIDDLGYRAHFYGPYSDDVAQAVERLKVLGFVDQATASIGTVDTRGFEVARCDSRLSDQGKQVAEIKAQQNPPFWEKLGQAVQVLEKADERNYVKLSIAAKTFFMLGERQGKTSQDELSRIADQFGWSVSPHEVKEAVEFLRSIDLV